MIDCWHAAWHAFGGYRYDNYAVKMRDPAESSDFSLSEVGVSVSDILFSRGGYEAVCHEIFHSWAGKLIAHVPDGTDNLFQLETWISEGTVFYYGIRNVGLALGVSEYDDGMEGRFNDYDSNKGTSLDLSIAELADLVGTDTSSDASDMLHARGTLINYLLDQELVARGFTLDDLLAYLYENFGLTDTQWTQSDIPIALNAVTGESFQTFFDTYLSTNAELTVDGTFDFLDHNN